MKDSRCTYIDWIITGAWIIMVIQIVLMQVNHNERIESYNNLSESLTLNNKLRETQINLMQSLSKQQMMLLHKINLGEEHE